jgi:hypothetical protein
MYADPYPDSERVQSGLQHDSAAEDGEESSLGEEDEYLEEDEEDEEDEDDEEGSPGFRGRSRDPNHFPEFDKRTFLSPKKRGKRPRSRPRKKEPDEQSKNNYPTSRQPPADRGWHVLSAELTWDAANDLMISHAKAHAPGCGYRKTGSRNVRSNGSWRELQQCGYVAETPRCPALRCLDYLPDASGGGTYSISVATGANYEHNTHDGYRVKGPPGAVYSAPLTCMPHISHFLLTQHCCHPAASLPGSRHDRLQSGSKSAQARSE